MNTRFLPIVALAGILLPAPVWSQPTPTKPPPGDVRNVELDPIRCWWRTGAGAVRVGETFSVVLTCAVLQNEAVQVVPDESRLGSAVAQMAPFEVVSGSHPADLYSGERRFFQYQYTLRVINPDAIGKDVRIPDQLIHYRVNSTVAANAALQGRDHTYLLPPQSVRVLSLVTADAPDIRDTSNESFDIAEQLGFRANVFEIVAVTAMALGGLIILLGFVRLIVRTQKRKPVGEHGLEEAAVLRLAARELSAVQRESEQGWSDALAARALAAARIVASSALGRPVGQRRGGTSEAGEGRLVLAGGRRRKSVTLSGASTPEDLARALERLPTTASPERRQLIEDLQSALRAFTTVLYGREATFDRTALDAALAHVIAAARTLKSERAWPKSYLRRWAPHTEAEQQT